MGNWGYFTPIYKWSYNPTYTCSSSPSCTSHPKWCFFFKSLRIPRCSCSTVAADDNSGSRFRYKPDKRHGGTFPQETSTVNGQRQRKLWKSSDPPSCCFSNSWLENLSRFKKKDLFLRKERSNSPDYHKALITNSHPNRLGFCKISCSFSSDYLWSRWSKRLKRPIR